MLSANFFLLAAVLPTCLLWQAADLGDAPVDAVLGELPGLAVEVRKAGGDKCERCWMYSEELGTDPAYPTVCPRCAAVLRELAAREEGAR